MPRLDPDQYFNEDFQREVSENCMMTARVTSAGQDISYLLEDAHRVIEALIADRNDILSK